MTNFRSSPSGPDGLDTDEVLNSSSVTGVTASDALDTLLAGIGAIGLPAVLTANPNTGANNILVGAGQSVRFGAAPAASGDIRGSGAFVIRSTGDLTHQSDAVARVTGATGTVVTATTGALSLAATAANVTITAGSTIAATSATAMTLTATTGTATLRALGGATTVTASGAITMTGGTGVAVTATTGSLDLVATAGSAGLIANALVNIQGAGSPSGVNITATVGALNLTATVANAGLVAGAGLFLTAGGAITGAANGGAMNLTGSNAATVTATTGAATLRALGGATSITATTTITATGGTGVTVTATTGTATLAATAGQVSLSAGTFVSVNNFLRFTEQAASTPSLGAGDALFWVRNDAPNLPFFTDDTNVDRQIVTAAPMQSQIGWSPATGTNSNTLTLLAAGHPAGIYSIDYVAVIRTVGVGASLSTTLTWNSPTFGAESKQLQVSSWATLGTVLSANGSSAGPKNIAIMSDGTAAITITWNSGAVTGPPVADLYAGARLLAS